MDKTFSGRTQETTTLAVENRTTIEDRTLNIKANKQWTDWKHLGRKDEDWVCLGGNTETLKNKIKNTDYDTF